MSTNQIVREFITTKMNADLNGFKLSDTDSLIDSGVVDSFGIMSLIGFLEEKFVITVSGEDLMPENFDSISAISAMVDKMTSQQA